MFIVKLFNNDNHTFHGSWEVAEQLLPKFIEVANTEGLDAIVRPARIEELVQPLVESICQIR